MRIWMTEFVWPVLLVFVPAGFFIPYEFKRLDAYRLYVLFGILLLCLLLMVKRIGLPLWRSRIEIDTEQITGRIDKGEFKFFWASIQAAWKTTAANQPFINLATSEQGGAIPIKFFDQEKLWQQVQQRVTPAALEKDAYKKLPLYQDYSKANAKIIGETVRPLRVKLTFMKALGWSVVVLLLGLAVGAYLSGERGVSFGFLAFSLLGVYLILASGAIEMDADVITASTPLSRYQIRWDEVRSVETDIQRQGIVFVGNDKRMAMPGPMYWSGADKPAMIKLYLAQIEQRNLEVKETQKALWRLSKNVKVR